MTPLSPTNYKAQLLINSLTHDEDERQELWLLYLSKCPLKKLSICKPNKIETSMPNQVVLKLKETLGGI